MEITAGQLRKIAKKHKFILLRRTDNTLVGLVTMSIFKGKNIELHDSAILNGYTSFKPCNIAEYITYKMGY